MKINQYNKEGDLIGQFDSPWQAELATGITCGSISKCAQGRLGWAGSHLFTYERKSVQHDLSDKNYYKLVHMYRCFDGINIHTTDTIEIGDTLLYKGKVYQIGKNTDMRSLVTESDTVKGCNYYEFTVKEVL